MDFIRDALLIKFNRKLIKIYYSSFVGNVDSSFNKYVS